MLRGLFVPVIFNPQSLPQKGAPLDVSLVRAAHRALLRQQSGSTDTFLFVLCGELTLEEATAAIAPYGFPDVAVICISTKDEDGNELDEDVREQIGSSISEWLRKQHPSAITSLDDGGYDSLDMWWTGVEAPEAEWDFLHDYAATLPYEHRKKAGTWLDILFEILELEQPCWSSVNQLSLYAATLCEWLHGFDKVSGNGNNGFEADEVYEALKMNDFYLGFLLGQSNRTETFDEILYNAETDDLDGIRSYTLKQAIGDVRSNLRDMLSKYFGSDTALFWSLRSAIWPQYTEPSVDLCNNLVNSCTWEDLAENDEPWQFITNGWTESADE